LIFDQPGVFFCAFNIWYGPDFQVDLIFSSVARKSKVVFRYGHRRLPLFSRRDQEWTIECGLRSSTP